MKAFYYLLFIAFLGISCNSVKRTKKLVAKGDYDKAISLAVKKLQKDKNAKEYDPHIGVLEEAFFKAQEADTRQVKFLKKDKTLLNAKEIYFIYLDLNARQNLIRPLLPLYSKEMGRNANFAFSDYSNDIIRAKSEYAKSLYQEADLYIQRNTKLDYRSAYNILCELDEMEPNYRDVNRLKDETHFQGTDFVLVQLNNHTDQFIPLRLERDLLDFNTYNLDEFWTEYHSRQDNGINYDYSVDLNFQTIQISPERISEKQFTRKATVKDGFDYRRDRGGNIVKDSLGNPIKIERFKDVSAVITMTDQQKQVFVGGTVVYTDLVNRRQLNSFPISTEFVFNNVFATFRGDDRALTADDRIIVNNRFVPFPNNEQMVFDAGTDIKERFKKILKDNSIQ